RSDPPLSNSDIIALLAFGRTRGQGVYTASQPGGNTNDTASASNAILGEALNATFTDRVQRLFGASRVTIDPQFIGLENNAAERGSMVERQLRQRGVSDERLLAAMAKVPRHEFVKPENWAEAYADHPIPIAEQQTTSQPYMIAAMVQAAGIKPEDRVLEIGAGSGYQTAVLAELASQVFAVERYASLTEAARATLERLGYRNAKVVTGDGSLGLPEA